MTKSYHHIIVELDTECGALIAEYYFDSMTSTLEVARYTLGREPISGDSLPWGTQNRLDGLAWDEVRERLG